MTPSNSSAAAPATLVVAKYGALRGKLRMRQIQNRLFARSLTVELPR